jgi:hypothetical protein
MNRLFYPLAGLMVFVVTACVTPTQTSEKPKEASPKLQLVLDMPLMPDSSREMEMKQIFGDRIARAFKSAGYVGKVDVLGNEKPRTTLPALYIHVEYWRLGVGARDGAECSFVADLVSDGTKTSLGNFEEKSGWWIRGTNLPPADAMIKAVDDAALAMAKKIADDSLIPGFARSK